MKYIFLYAGAVSSSNYLEAPSKAEGHDATKSRASVPDAFPQTSHVLVYSSQPGKRGEGRRAAKCCNFFRGPMTAAAALRALMQG